MAIALMYVRYEHFDFGGCKLFRNQDYLSLEEEKDSDEKIPEKEEELEDLLMSSCPRCDRVIENFRVLVLSISETLVTILHLNDLS